MINVLTGIVRETDHHAIIVDVSGIGFAVFVPDELVFTRDQRVELSTYMHWNQENGPQLYGFLNQEMRTVFCLIIGCSGFGPKIGLTILSSMKPQQFLEAIALADQKALSSISGVGPKKAENLIIQLKDKIAKLSLKSGETNDSGALTIIKQVSEALSSLHYSRPEINNAVEHVKKNYTLDNISFDDTLRKALAFLSKH